MAAARLQQTLAAMVRAQRRRSETIDLLEEILPVAQRTLGDDHIGVSMIKHNLAPELVLQEDGETQANYLSSNSSCYP